MENNFNPESIIDRMETGKIKREPKMFWDGFCHCPSQKKKEGECEICGGRING